MGGMFYDTYVSNGDLSSWDVSAVTDMEGMFDWAIAFDCNLSSWNVSAVTNMRNMFAYRRWRRQWWR